MYYIRCVCTINLNQTNTNDSSISPQKTPQAKAYEPLQYLLTTLYLLSHTAVQTDVTCFWWRPEAVIEELWAPRNLRALVASIELVMDKVCGGDVYVYVCGLGRSMDPFIHVHMYIKHHDSPLPIRTQ